MGFFFLGLVAGAADELAVLVALEVGQPHDYRLGPERGGDGGDALDELVDVEGAWRGMAPATLSTAFFRSASMFG